MFFYAALLFSLVIIWPIFFPLTLGITLAYVCEAPVDYIQKKLAPQRAKNLRARWLSSLAMVLGITLLFGVPLVLFLVTGVQQLVELVNTENEAGFSVLSKFDEGVKWSSAWLRELGLNVSGKELVAKAKEWSGRAAEVLGAGAASFVSATPTAIFDVVLTYMTWFLFLARGREMRSVLLPLLLPWPRERAIICRTTGEVIRSIIVSNVLVSVIQAFLVWVVLAIAQVPHASLWAGIAFFMSFIPVFGTAPVLIGSAIYLYMHGQVGMSIFVVIGSLVVAVVDNVLRPMLVRSSAELSFFWVFIAFVGGIAQFGVGGTVLGPLAFSLVVAAHKALGTEEI